MDSQPVLILGGGINGAALARELLYRRIPVVLVDTNDLGFGATSRSSRLIHGGLRYLEYGEFSLVRESLAERTRLLQVAPHLVRPLRLHIPVATRLTGVVGAVKRLLGLKPRAGVPRGLWLVRAGLWFYDWYAADPSARPSTTRRLSRPDAPPLNADRYRWACSYDDGWIHYPERLVIEWLEDARRQSEQNGAPLHVFTHSRARLDGDKVTVEAVDSEAAEPVDSSRAASEPRFQCRPRLIVNATGAWVDATLERLKRDSKRLMGGTKGSHLLVANEALARMLDDDGVYVEAEDGRPVFILPMGELTLVGTTDIPFEDSPETAIADRSEIEYLVEAVRRVLPDADLTADDVVGHYAGVRPLPYVDASTPAAVTRRHFLHPHEGAEPPMVSVIGGKLTTCRALAEEAAEWVLSHHGEGGREASTQSAPTPGGRDYPREPAEREDRLATLARETGFPAAAVREVWELYGTRTGEVLERIAAYGEEARRPIGDDLPLPVGLARFVCEREWAESLSDLVERRLMLVYRRSLRRSWLRALASEMHPQAGPEAVEGEAACCERRLLSHYGRRVVED